jgi:hypothetical protein
MISRTASTSGRLVTGELRAVSDADGGGAASETGGSNPAGPIGPALIGREEDPLMAAIRLPSAADARA